MYKGENILSTNQVCLFNERSFLLSLERSAKLQPNQWYRLSKKPRLETLIVLPIKRASWF